MAPPPARSSVGAKTHAGNVRPTNQDNVLVAVVSRPNAAFAGDLWCLAVADGMGGHAGGETASAVALQAVQAVLIEDPPGNPNPDELVAYLRVLVEQANEAVRHEKVRQPALAEMGTTLTVALADNRRLCLGHVGDSRAYVIRDKTARLVTEDHTVVAEELRRGLISMEEAAFSSRRHVLRRAVGAFETIQVQTSVVDLEGGDCVLLCTDGLYNDVSEDQMTRLAGEAVDAGELCNELLSAGRARGGSDNLTAAALILPAGASKTLPDGPVIAARPRHTVARLGLVGTLCFLAVAAGIAIRQSFWRRPGHPVERGYSATRRRTPRASGNRGMGSDSSVRQASSLPRRDTAQSIIRKPAPSVSTNTRRAGHSDAGDEHHDLIGISPVGHARLSTSLSQDERQSPP